MTDTVTAVEREKRELGSSSSVSSKNLTAVPFPFTVPFLLSQSGGGRVVSRGAAAWLLHPSWGRGGRRRLFRLFENSTGFEGMHKKLRADPNSYIDIPPWVESCMSLFCSTLSSHGVLSRK